MKERPLLTWFGLFVAGFIAGIVFSAWKLEKTTGLSPAPSVMPRQQEAPADIRTRMADLEKRLTVNPNDVDALIQLGNDYFDVGNHEKAIETYQRALQINPRNPEVFTDMGISYRKLGKSQEAVKAFRKALEVEPDHPIALFNLGIVLRDDLKDYAEALKVWETFLKKAGDSPHAVMVRPWVEQLREKLGSAPSQSDDRAGENVRLDGNNNIK